MIIVEFFIYIKLIPYFSLQIQFGLIITAICKSLKNVLVIDACTVIENLWNNVFEYIKYWYMNYMFVFIAFVNTSFVWILSNSVEWWQPCWYWSFGESPNHQTNHSSQKVVQVSQVCERYQYFNACLKNTCISF